MHGAVVEGVVRRAVHALERFVAQLIVRGVEVDVVIADDVVPGDADQGDGRVERLEERQVVEHDVAERDAERRFGPDQFGHDVVSDVVDFFLVAWLRVAEHDRAELVRLILRVEREVDRLGQRACRFDARVLALGRAFGLVDVVEAGQVVLAERCAPAARLDDEDDRVVADGQSVSAGVVGLDDRLAVGDAHAGQRFFARVVLAVVVGVVVDDAGCFVRRRGVDRREVQAGHQGQRRGQRLHRFAPRKSFE